MSDRDPRQSWIVDALERFAGIILGSAVLAVFGLFWQVQEIKWVVENLPPEALLHRIENMELEQKRLQRQIDRLESFHFPEIKKQPLPPYSYMPPGFLEGDNG